jgi:hypothetical protein
LRKVLRADAIDNDYLQFVIRPCDRQTASQMQRKGYGCEAVG